MLDEKDIQVIRELMAEQLAEQETRLTAKIEEQETRLTAKIEEQETRLAAKIDEQETRLTAKIDEQETRLTAKIDEQETRLTAKIDEAQKSAVKEAVELSTHYMDVLYETKIEPQFRLLAEGHQTLLETLAPKNRVEALEEDVEFLKTVVSSLNKEIKELKKAM